MRRLQENKLDKPPVSARYAYPSFSSTLLDSIYRSIDDDNNHTTPKWSRSPPVVITRPRKQTPPPPPVTTSSSSDNSSYGGFSSSEPETVRPNRLRPVRVSSRPVSNPAQEKKIMNKKIRPANNNNLGSRSPAARLAGFLNSLFKTKHSGEVTSSSTSSSRSCLMRKQMPSSSVRVPVPKARVKDVMTWQDEDDDVASESSSELFELENLGTSYRDELPVFETTRLRGMVL